MVAAKSIKPNVGFLAVEELGDGAFIVVEPGPGMVSWTTYGASPPIPHMAVKGDIVVGPTKPSATVEVDGKKLWIVRADSIAAVVIPAEAAVPQGV